jgi:hypothetical protein
MISLVKMATGFQLNEIFGQVAQTKKILGQDG